MAPPRLLRHALQHAAAASASASQAKVTLTMPHQAGRPGGPPHPTPNSCVLTVPQQELKTFLLPLEVNVAACKQERIGAVAVEVTAWWCTAAPLQQGCDDMVVPVLDSSTAGCGEAWAAAYMQAVISAQGSLGGSQASKS